jgi:hypothetical protein
LPILPVLGIGSIGDGLVDDSLSVQGLRAGCLRWRIRLGLTKQRRLDDCGKVVRRHATAVVFPTIIDHGRPSRLSIEQTATKLQIRASCVSCWALRDCCWCVQGKHLRAYRIAIMAMPGWKHCIAFDVARSWNLELMSVHVTVVWEE